MQKPVSANQVAAQPMTLEAMNALLKDGVVVTFCPFEAWSNQCLVKATMVAGNRTVSYEWESLDGQTATKTAQVGTMAWRYIVDRLTNEAMAREAADIEEAIRQVGRGNVKDEALKRLEELRKALVEE